MARLPLSLVIAIWLVGAMWIVGLIAHFFGFSSDLVWFGFFLARAQPWLNGALGATKKMKRIAETSFASAICPGTQN